LQVGDTGPVESARRSNSRVLGSPFSGLSGQYVFTYVFFTFCQYLHCFVIFLQIWRYDERIFFSINFINLLFNFQLSKPNITGPPPLQAVRS
jgi:hypothetical protein